MTHPILVLCACMALLLAADVAAETQKGFISKTVSIGSKDFKYVVYVPSDYDGKKEMPAIVFLNGKGECGSDGWRQVFHFGSAIMLNAEKWPFIIMFPQKQSPETQWEDEEAMVLAVLEKTRQEYKIDDSR
ncbi:MAG: hypothetical protein QME62_10445, partial [Armatimonadota bacterium]|nr:hypothetical protein [Armatimonadota bacterium]